MVETVAAILRPAARELATGIDEPMVIYNYIFIGLLLLGAIVFALAPLVVVG